MRFLDRPLRLLLVATFGLLPLLCCCAGAKAAEPEPVAAADKRGCCASEQATAEPERTCDCEHHVEAMKGQAESQPPAPTTLGGFHLLPPAPLPDLIASAFIEADARALPTPGWSVAPAAPTLRSLSVLLLN